jgi:putative copper export protein
MLQTTDIEGRLRLFRYGLIVVVIVTFLVSLLAPYVITSAYATELNKVAEAVDGARVDITIGTFFGQAIIATVVVGVLLAAVYLFYRSTLTKTATSA